MSDKFDYEEFGAELAFQRDYPKLYEQEKRLENEKKMRENCNCRLEIDSDFHPETKDNFKRFQGEYKGPQISPGECASLKDSLQFLLEVSGALEQHKKGEMEDNSLLSYFIRRQEEWGYIADPKHIQKLIKLL